MLPPGRPSGYHLGLFEKHLQRVPRDRSVAVLGSTPELLDLCVELGFGDVWSIDRSLVFHETVDRFRVYRRRGETVIVADWLDALPTLPNQFGAVLSDLTLGNVHYANRQRFFDAIRQSLAAGGLFIDKVLTNEAPFHRLDDLDARYRRSPLNLCTINRFSSEYFFCSELVEKHGVVDVARFSQELSERFSEPRLRRLLDESLLLTTPSGVWHYGMPWSQVAATYGAGLRRVAEYAEEAGSAYEGRLRVIVSAKVPAKDDQESELTRSCVRSGRAVE